MDTPFDVQSRDFNRITWEKDIVRKESDDRALQGEIYYYQNIPTEISHLFPAMLSHGKNYYTTECIRGPSLSYIYIHKKMTEDNLSKLLEALEIIHQTPSGPLLGLKMYLNYEVKIKERYEGNRKIYDTFADAHEVYNELQIRMKEYADKNLGIEGTIHGDPVFTNILLAKDGIKMIDMRGIVGEEMSIRGDIFYDFGKVYQSICGYDFSIHGLVRNEEQVAPLKKRFEEYVRSKWDESRLQMIKVIASGLLFSCIPLHNTEKGCKHYELSKEILWESR